MTFLIVAKDLGAAAVLAPIGTALVKSGERVYGIAEGLAVKVFGQASLLAHELQGPYTQEDATLLVRRVRPRAVITGLSSPINAEETIGCAANDLGLPLAVVEDFWGAVARTRARPDFVGIPDKSVIIHTLKRCPDAEIIVTGNPGAKKVTPSAGVLDEVGRLRQKYDRIYLFTESGPDAALEQLDLLVKSLQVTAGNWCLVPRFHPKWVDRAAPGGSTYGALWQARLAPIIDRVVTMQGTSDELVSVVDVTVSVFSTLLTIAAYNSKACVSLDTPLSREYLSQTSGGLTVAPQVTLGFATRVATPADLSTVTHRDAGIRPYDPTPLVQALQRLH